VVLFYGVGLSEVVRLVNDFLTLNGNNRKWEIIGGNNKDSGAVEKIKIASSLCSSQ
jgi:hypothetical protein